MVKKYVLDFIDINLEEKRNYKFDKLDISNKIEALNIDIPNFEFKKLKKY